MKKNELIHVHSLLVEIATDSADGGIPSSTCGSDWRRASVPTGHIVRGPQPDCGPGDCRTAHRRREVRIARIDQHIIGCVRWRSTVAETNRTRPISTETLRRTGPRTRYSAATARPAEELLRQAGADILALEAMADNESARRFYRRHGYRPHRVELEKSMRSDTHSKEDG